MSVIGCGSENGVVPPTNPVDSSLTTVTNPPKPEANSTPGINTAPINTAPQPLDLLAAINPQDNSLGGRWKRKENSLHSIGSAKLKVPVVLDGDYRVRMRFTRQGNQQIMLALKAAGRRFVIVVNSKGNDVHGVSTVNGKPVFDGQNPTQNKTLKTELGKSYLLETDVRVDGDNVAIKTTLNNKPLIDWTGPASQLDNQYWQIPTPIGFGSESRDTNAVVEYDELTLTMLNGNATSGHLVTKTVPTPAPSTPAPNNPSPNPRQEPKPPASTANSVNATPLTAARDTIGFRTDFGVYATANPPTEWDADQNIAWKTPLPGAGSSTPIVMGNRIYLTAYSGYGQDRETIGDISALKFRVLAIDMSNGRIAWNTPISPARRSTDFHGIVQQHGFASSTLASDGERLFAFFGNSGGYAFDLNGHQLWQFDCGKSTSGFGSGASPVVYGDVVIFNVSVESKSLIAVDRATGREVWRTQKGLLASYTTPVIVPVDDNHEVVVASKAGLTGFNATSGEFLWEWHAGKFTEDYACVTPIIHDGMLFGSQNRRSTLSAIRPGGRGDVSSSHTVWHSNTRFDSTVVSPAYHNGKLFWLKDGQFGVFDATSGELVKHGRAPWKKIYASPIIAGGKLYVVSRYDGGFVLQADRELSQISHNVITGDDSQFNASPILHQGQLLLRSDQSLYCIGQ